MTEDIILRMLKDVRNSIALIAARDQILDLAGVPDIVDIIISKVERRIDLRKPDQKKIVLLK